MIIAIAWRNIWRNKLRSLVVILAVALGLFGTLFIIALSNGMVEQKVSDSVHNEISHIQVHHPDFLQDNSLYYNIENATQVEEIARNIPVVKGVTGRIRATAMASTATTGTGVIILGIDPESEKQVTDIHKLITEGSYFEASARSSQILISRKLAGKLKAKTGSKIVITMQNMSGELIYGLFRVAGIFKTSNGMYDELHVFVTRNDLSELTGFDPEFSTEIAILMNRTEDTDQALTTLQQALPGLSVLPWYILEPTLKMMSSMMDQFSYFLLAIMLAAMAFGIINTMLMSILERTRELGMLMSVGMNRKKVFLMIMMETIFLSVVGTLAGVVLSYITVTLTAKNGINFAAWAEGFESLGYSALMYPVLYTDLYFVLGAMVIVTAVVASIFPARKALKLKPAEAVRHEA